MTYSMQIKLKDESVLPFVDSVFAERGFKKEVKFGNELIYSIEGETGYNKMFNAIRPLRNKQFIDLCYKWQWVQTDGDECIYCENCLEEVLADEK